MNFRPPSKSALVLLAGAILVAVLLAAGVASYFGNRGKGAPLPQETMLIESALSRQAEHERTSKESIRSANTATARRAGNATCIDLRNRNIPVSSSYCYRLEGARWKLDSERVATQ